MSVHRVYLRKVSALGECAKKNTHSLEIKGRRQYMFMKMIRLEEFAYEVTV